MPHLEFAHIGKVFPGVRALDDVSFGADEGSVHALMGENGAGKSTLLKILSGAYQASAGEVRIGGQAHLFRSTGEALAAGVAVIYQELHLVPEMTVAENLYLGHLPARRRDRAAGPAARGCAAAAGVRLGRRLIPTPSWARLSIGQRQMVEIAKALTRGRQRHRLRRADQQPLGPRGEQLFRVIRQLRDEGKVILYVSHRMDEIFALCDAITVFRTAATCETFPSHGRGGPPICWSRRMVGRD
jgi:L-arabinose transport system ATP-binding protein